MSVASCIARQKNARKWTRNTSWGPGRAKPGAMDINCQNCKQGKEIMENHKSESEKVEGLEGETKPDRIDALIDTICLEEGIDRKFLHSRIYSKKKLRPLRVKLSRALKEKGLKNKEIAQKIGCAEGSLWNYMKTGRDEHRTSNAQHRTSNEKIKKDEKIEGPEKNTLIVDFSKHPETLERIKEIAADKLRKPENQVLYWLKEFSIILEKETTNEHE